MQQYIKLILFLLTSRQQCVWQMPVAVCTVLNFWWWTERPSKASRVSFQNEFDTLVHVVGFNIEIILRCTALWTSDMFYNFIELLDQNTTRKTCIKIINNLWTNVKIQIVRLSYKTLLNLYMHILVLLPYLISLMHGHGLCKSDIWRFSKKQWYWFTI